MDCLFKLFLSPLERCLILCPIGAFKHDSRGHFKWQFINPKKTVQRGNAFYTFPFQQEPFALFIHRAQSTAGNADDAIKSGDVPFFKLRGCKVYSFRLVLRFFYAEAYSHQCHLAGLLFLPNIISEYGKKVPCPFFRFR